MRIVRLAVAVSVFSILSLSASAQSAPTITTYSPSLGSAGTTVTIQGSGFGVSQGGSIVAFVSTANVWTHLTPTRVLERLGR